MNSSIILLPNWIGDLLLALSIVSRLPEPRRSKTTLLVPYQMSGLVRLLIDLPQIEFIRTNAADQKRTLSVVRNGAFHTIYLLPYSFSSAWFALKTKIPVRRGIAREMRGIMLTEPLPVSLSNMSHHITREYAEIIDTPFLLPEEWGGTMVTADKEYSGSIVYCPGAKYGPSKKWPHFPELALLQEDKRIVILGTNEDRQSAEEIVRSAPERVTDLTGKTSLTEAASIMSGADAVISNDSGLMHLAGYIGTPVIGIFGSTSPKWTHPLGKKSVVMNFPEPCSPCFDRTCRYHHYRCLENISAIAVAEAMETLCCS